MQLNHPGRGLRSVAVLVLCAMFFLLAIGVTLLGSGVYRSTTAAADQNFTHRTALSYLVNQVRRGDILGGVEVTSFDGNDALLLREGDYVTILYCFDGQLRELYTEPGTGLLPQDGIPILPLNSLQVSALPNGIQLTVTGSRDFSVTVSPRCGYLQSEEVFA